LPVAISDFTDFYASVFHATNAGRAFRPDNPLLPNYKYVPVAYHGRASSVRVSGTPVKRPQGQRKAPNDEAPSYGPSHNMDFELELGPSPCMPQIGAQVMLAVSLPSAC
jgi:fumarylacetoacetase